MNIKKWFPFYSDYEELSIDEVLGITHPKKASESNKPYVSTPESKPDISSPAMELAEAIESGKVVLYETDRDINYTIYKCQAMNTEFILSSFCLNTEDHSFTRDEAKLLAKALSTYNAKAKDKKQAETRGRISEYFVEINKEV